MSLVFKHGQRCNFLPRQQGCNMNWVSQRSTSDYRAMTTTQAFDLLLNIPEPKRTRTPSGPGDCSASVGTVRPDVEGSRLRQVGDLRTTSLCRRKIQSRVLRTVHGGQNSPTHGASSVRIMGRIVGWKFRLSAAKFFERYGGQGRS